MFGINDIEEETEASNFVATLMDFLIEGKEILGDKNKFKEEINKDINKLKEKINGQQFEDEVNEQWGKVAGDENLNEFINNTLYEKE